jgi:hypothetical protein
MTAAAMVVGETHLVRDLNDAFRRSFAGGRVVLTPGIAGMSDADRLATIKTVQSFTAFTPENDPYGDHDFGSVVVAGQTVFWKIDCYDLALTYGSPDPADPAVTTRVLTVMLAEEY